MRPGAVPRTAKVVTTVQFSAGQTVIHPHHGPVTVVETFERPVRGVPRRYLGLQVHRSDLRIAVPLDRTDEIGLRPVSAATQVSELLDVLRAPSDEQEETWSRRFKANQEKLRLGDLRVTAGVVRDLTRRLEERGLSLGEKDQLKHARIPVLTELALALSLTDEEAEEMLDSAVHGADEPASLAAAS